MFWFSIVQHLHGYGVTEEQDFVMVVHRKSLLELVPLDLLEGPPNPLPIVLSWNSWGPPVTRWFGDDEVSESSISLYGQRFVLLASSPLPAGAPATDELEDEDEDAMDTIAIYDFNPWHVREVRLHKEFILAAHDSCSDNLRIDIFDGDEAPGNICSARNLFKFDIIGRLPYIRYSSSNWPDFEDIMIDEERLIGIRASSLPQLFGSVLTALFGTSCRWRKKWEMA
jgi:hypothetical protein